MRRWLKTRLPQRQALEQRWYLRPFAKVLLDPACWHFNRHGVAKSFAAGLFIAFLPPTPFLHVTMTLILGLWLRLNLPIMFATIFLSNPFTWVPQLLASVWVGAKLLGLDLAPIIRLFRHQGLSVQLHALWGPLLLGAVVLGMAAALLGYALTQCAWRARVVYLLRRRRAHASAKSGTFH
ncbi:MAG: DUF2062 domain-containing protein [Proteobacteria bacterium]|nr:DUF2062 domain-containing protein [Pseudomonadota bacterium]